MKNMWLVILFVVLGFNVVFARPFNVGGKELINVTDGTAPSSAATVGQVNASYYGPTNIIVRKSADGSLNTYTSFQVAWLAAEDYDSLTVYPGRYEEVGLSNIGVDLYDWKKTGVSIRGIGVPIIDVVGTNILSAIPMWGISFYRNVDLSLEGLHFKYTTLGSNGVSGAKDYLARFDWSSNVTVHDCIFEWDNQREDMAGQKTVIPNGSTNFNMYGGAILSYSSGGSDIYHLATHDADPSNPPRFHGVTFGGDNVTGDDVTGDLGEFIDCFYYYNVFDAADNLTPINVELLDRFSDTDIENLLSITFASSRSPYALISEIVASTNLESGASVIWLGAGLDYDDVPQSFSGTIYLLDGFENPNRHEFYDWSDAEVIIIGMGRNTNLSSSGQCLRWERATNLVVQLYDMNFISNDATPTQRLLYTKQGVNCLFNTYNCDFNLSHASTTIRSPSYVEAGTNSRWIHHGGRVVVTNTSTFAESATHYIGNNVEFYTNGTFNAPPDLLRTDTTGY